MSDLPVSPPPAQLRRLLRQAIGQNARDTWCRMHGINDPQNVSSFLHGKIKRPPRQVYAVLGFAPPVDGAMRMKMRWALVRMKAKQAQQTESVLKAL